MDRLLEHERFKTAAQMLMQKQQIEDAVLTNPALKQFQNDEGTEPELAADVIDLVDLPADSGARQDAPRAQAG